MKEQQQRQKRPLKNSASKLSNQRGFTLIEVLIAVTIFAVFSSAYLVTQGNNLSDSTQIRRETVLEDIANQLINETIANPPEFTKSLLINPENDYKKFEENESYEYRIEWHEFKIPDLAKIQGKEPGQEADGQRDQVNQIVFDNVKRNLEQKIWQLVVIVREVETKFSFDLSTWVLNPTHKIEFSGVGI